MINGVLKDRMGFEGFVISDWQAIDQIPGDYASDVRTSVNAGLDMIMVPTAYQDFTHDARRRGDGRPDQPRPGSTTPSPRILTQKFRLGLFEKPYADTRDTSTTIGSAAHRAVAREAAAKSQVLLKNDGGVLPLKPSPEGVRRRLQRRRPRQPDRRLDRHLAGLAPARSPRARRSWRASKQDAAGRPPTPRTPPPRRDGYDVGVVVVGETPYAEGIGDVGNGNDLELTDADKAAVDKVCARDEVRGADRLRAARSSSATGSATSTRWSRPGCRAPRATASPTSCTASAPSPASSRSPGRSRRPSCRSTSATRRTTRSSRTAGV